VLQKRIADRHGKHFKDMYLDRIRAFEGASDLIAKVHTTGRKVVLASSAKRDEIEHYVSLLGVAGCLAATTSIDDVDASKPEPDIFGATLEKIRIEASRPIVVRDTIYDIEAALRAGIVAVGLVSGPFSEAQTRDAGAMAVFHDAADLLARFDRSPLAQ
jgi:membrane protein